MCFLTLSVSPLASEESLKNLIKYDKAICLERLEKATNEELWDAFLEGQAELFFEPEFQWIANQGWWKDVKSILEIGSGNGAYLSTLADHFPEKTFYGVEKVSLSVKHANERYARDRIVFTEGDAEIFNEQLVNSFEGVLFRLTLQHLKNPLLALQNTWHYLQSNGYVLIIDSCDSAKKTSHPITTIDVALKLVAESQRNKGIGNRKITLEMLQMLENEQSHLSDLYEIVSSNLDVTGKFLHENTRLEGEQSRKLYFNHNLLFLALLHRTYHVQIDLDKAYNELKEYLEDENAWTVLGMHYLVIKKKLGTL
ncbi:MAG: methyltransferase domain-containing protein [Parachlamydiaceae bacterium]|nr:methyltransferase domain-containing protein [Parachlamydiaceae bacterium]